MFQVVLSLNNSFAGCHKLNRVTCPVNKTVEFKAFLEIKKMRTENSFGEILNLVRKIILVALDFFKKVFSKQFFSKIKPRERNHK